MKFTLRKAQASIEFLSTYVWAFMVLLAAIGVLSYLNVFDFSNAFPEECDTGTQISCVDGYIGVAGGNADMYLLLRNNYPKEINISEVRINTAGGVSITSNEADVRMRSARSATFTFSNTQNEFLAGKKGTFTVEIDYQRYDPVSPSTQHTMYGKATIESVGISSLGVEPYCGDGTVNTPTEECDPATGLDYVTCLSDCTTP